MSGARPGTSPTPGSITVQVPLAVRRRPGRKTIVTPEGVSTPGGGTATAVIRTQADPALLKALARAHRWKRLLDEGRYASLTELAAAEKLERGFLGRLLQLTLLAPNIVEAVLDGRQSPGLGLPRLMEPFPTTWAEQEAALRISTNKSVSEGQS
ncbi:hypothetical protein [Roseomonas sp. BN140053]|uniref:hypothetical protein n=1 Tax=Roseomonas sp. BN140053 TaxID=3391898 RepID=UPI0039E72E7B